jgi:hypothetical protein
MRQHKWNFIVLAVILALHARYDLYLLLAVADILRAYFAG